MTEIIAPNARTIVAEPDRTVGLDDDIIRPGELLAVEPLGEHGNRAVIFGACQALGIHLAGDEPALAVAGIAVGVMRRPAEYIDRASLLLPFHDSVIGDVAPQQKPAITEPHRPLGKATTADDTLDSGVAEHQR